MFLDAGASGAAIAAEGLHLAHVGRARGQIHDVHKILLQDAHDDGGRNQVIILTTGDQGETKS